ncbi:STAS domain-containing protein [Nocardioides panacisoli]|uniref:SulP family inorganic anion transporter n=1 Tax=Nocardioides panacisoli TaxID=627624 RepID=UPI001C634EBE|nr:SulP family inorganic anion transporter [Nocardioides panacisoli]QYJ04825.1 STAS domain-containing protein [Nocardioides panacisoli]
MSSEQDAGGLTRRPARNPSTFLPILGWAPRYRVGRDLRPDLVAGIALAALLIPESIGYAGIAGVPPEVGLYAAIAAVAVYALTGGTSILVVGPASAVAALSASLVAELASDGADPVALTAALAVSSGLLLLLAGLLRLGWIVNFISRPVLHAFVAGLSLSIIIGQLDDLLGVEIDAESAVVRAGQVVARVGQWDPATVVLGVLALGLLVGLERWAARVPGALVVVVGAIAAVWAFGLDDGTIAVLGSIPQGLPAPALPGIDVRTWLEVTVAGAALVLVGFSEGYAAASAVSDSTGEKVDGDQELVGAGAANVAAGLFGGQAVSGSLTKSAASQAAGARTQVANLSAGAILVLTLVVLAPVFELLPEAVVSAVVIAAVLPAAKPSRVLDLWSVNRLDFAAGLTTYVLVLVWETLPAMIVGVALSLVFLVRRASFPDVVEVRRSEDGTFREVEDDAPALTHPDVAVVRFEASLVYANADRLVRAVDTLLEERSLLRRVVLDAEMIADLDSTGAEALLALDGRLAERGVELRLARIHRRARGQLERSGLAARFEGRIHPHVVAATLD